VELSDSSAAKAGGAVAEARDAALPAKRAALAAQVLALPSPTSPGVDDLSDGRAGRPVYCTRTLLKETTALARARARLRRELFWKSRGAPRGPRAAERVRARAAIAPEEERHSARQRRGFVAGSTLG
jgi:hypothetical protein